MVGGGALSETSAVRRDCLPGSSDELQQLELELAPEHLVSFRKRAWLQITFEESLVVGEFGGREAYLRRTRPSTEYGLRSLKERFFGREPTRPPSGEAAAEGIAMGVERLSPDEWDGLVPDVGSTNGRLMGRLALTILGVSLDSERQAEPYCQVHLTGGGACGGLSDRYFRTEARTLEGGQQQAAWEWTEFTLPVTSSAQLLHLAVFDHALFAEDKPLGEVILPVEQLMRLGAYQPPDGRPPAADEQACPQC